MYELKIQEGDKTYKLTIKDTIQDQNGERTYELKFSYRYPLNLEEKMSNWKKLGENKISKQQLEDNYEQVLSFVKENLRE